MATYIEVTTSENDKALINLDAVTRIVQHETARSSFIRVFFDNGHSIDVSDDYTRFLERIFDLKSRPVTQANRTGDTKLMRLFGLKAAP